MRKIYTRYIFAIEALLYQNLTYEHLLKKSLGLNKDDFIKMQTYIKKYKEITKTLTCDGLVTYLNENGITLNITELKDAINDKQSITYVYEGVREFLVALKGHNKQISVISKDLKEVDSVNLERSRLISFVDTFVLGCGNLVENKEILASSMLYTPKEQCLFISDHSKFITPCKDMMDVVTINEENKNYIYRKLRREI